ncbi:Putative transcription factor Grauzone [Septoria linicola]|uniref:Transcription factor Grauzone n=1 Tax=Septoria linicola TaxID=215465 RepID=A0A9Q9AKJ1_9PEZI|nr:putative transcription factor Grauzone [Septoria linicola]USW51097.1 Putative transcription factor Grauzone [Septoria linicola]
MYTWYAYATVCIVYLHDVAGEASGISACGSDPTTSIWFDRGLTMLELIAPREVIFANSVWDLMGHKDEQRMISLVTTKTKIPVHILLNTAPPEEPIRQTIPMRPEVAPLALPERQTNGHRENGAVHSPDEPPRKIARTMEEESIETPQPRSVRPPPPPPPPTLSMSTRSAVRPRTDVDRQPNSKRRGSWCKRLKEGGSGDEKHQTSASKGFPCPFIIYGCPSTFGIKNEWKRHVHTQHMRLAYWRCEQCSEINDSRRPNDFNRRDLFVQHVRRMHPFTPGASPGKKSKIVTKGNDAEEQYLADEATRCYRQLRRAPESSRCLLCDQHFRGPNSWEQRMEHVGRHFEDIKKSARSPAPLDPREWHHDRDLEQYLLEEGIIDEQGKRLVLSDGS